VYCPRSGLREAALACVDDLSLDIDEMVLLTNTVSFYVRGYVASELADDDARRRSGMDMAAWMTAHAPYGRAIIDSGAFPRVIRVMRDAEGPHRPNRRAHDFELGLERVLDGIAAGVKSVKSKPRARKRRSQL
jgi:Tetracyclin repressor-like, C-terminal domain